MPILHAPILEQAGFSIGSDAPEPVINYVARLDGVSQEWEVTPIPCEVGDKVYVSFKRSSKPTGNHDGLLASSSDYEFLNIVNFNTNGTVNFSGVSSSTIDGAPVSNNQNIESYFDGEWHKLEVVVSEHIHVNVLGGLRFVNYSYEGILKDFGMVRVAGDQFIPLTNKPQGATQLATVGDINAFMPNYSSDVWEVDSSAS